MEKYENETIAAIATALSDSGIGIVRISGENAIYIIDNIFRRQENLDKGTESYDSLWLHCRFG
jgi:tRNA modification GTPase